MGVDLLIYPCKGYSETFKLLRPDAAPMVSMIDDRGKCAMSRLGGYDTRLEADGGAPDFRPGLRPAMPTNIPYIGQTPAGKLRVKVRHGTLGWTHGTGQGKAIAVLVSGEKSALNLSFYGA